MSANFEAQGLVQLPLEQSEELHAMIARRLTKEGNPSTTSLRAPFVKTKEQGRLIISGNMELAEFSPCEINLERLEGGSASMSISLVGNEKMGRPLLRPSSHEDADSHYGNQFTKEEFVGFCLRLYSGGVAYMSGKRSEACKGIILDGVNSEELYLFGRALFFGIDKHEGKIKNKNQPDNTVLTA